jgi:outer membrane protein TolC
MSEAKKHIQSVAPGWSRRHLHDRPTARSLVLFVFAALSWPGQSRADIVSLAELEKRALESKGLRETYAANARGAESEVAKAKAAYHPQIGFRADMSTITGSQLVEVRDAKGNAFLVSGARSLDQPRAFRPRFRQSVDVSLSQRLYDFGRTRAAVDAGRSFAQSVQADQHAVAEDLVRAVRASYLKWLAAHELARIAQGGAKDTEQERARIEALIDSGVRPTSDLAPARGEELLAHLEHRRMLHDVAAARYALEDAVGGRIERDAEPDPALLQTDVHHPPSGKPDDPVQRSLERRRAAAHARALAFRRGRYPEFGLAASLGLRAQDSVVVPLYALGLSFAVPLWDGGTSRANASAAEAEAEGIAVKMHSHDVEREQTLERAERDAENARERLAIAEQLVIVGQNGLLVARDGYQLGARPVEAVFAAQAMLRKAQTETLLAKVARAEAALVLSPHATVDVGSGESEAH